MSGWDETQDNVVVSTESNLPKFFQKFPLIEDVTFSQVCMKDSRGLTEEDLTKLAKTIEESTSDRIVITHGLYTLPDTVKYLKQNLKCRNKTIILTGASTPLIGFNQTDAGFNLGYAIAKVQELSPGIYVSMKGRAFGYDELEKNIKEGRLHEII